MGTEREKWVDIARGFTIYLMVLGHCIQFATPIDYDYKENMIYCRHKNLDISKKLTTCGICFICQCL